MEEVSAKELCQIFLNARKNRLEEEKRCAWADYTKVYDETFETAQSLKECIEVLKILHREGISLAPYETSQFDIETTTYDVKLRFRNAGLYLDLKCDGRLYISGALEKDRDYHIGTILCQRDKFQKLNFCIPFYVEHFNKKLKEIVGEELKLNGIGV